jgi:DNA-binding transcriptional ArsR family regulator
MLFLVDFSAVAGKAEIRLNAGMECCLALWAARAPEREPLSNVARQIEAAMPAPRREALRSLDNSLSEWPLRALNAFHRVGVEDFGEALARLRQEDPRRLALDFLLAFEPGCDAAACARAPDPLAAALASGRLPASATRDARSLLHRPAETVFDVLDVLHGFWRAGFGRRYAEQQRTLRALAQVLRSRLASDPRRALASISPRAVLDAGHDRLTFLGGHSTRVVSCADLERFEVVPSLWLRRRIVLTSAPGSVALSVGCGPAHRDELASEGVGKALAALADERRLEILRLCLEQPRTTSELAPMLGITEGPVSRHLKELERQGLVVGERFGRNVTYTAVVEVLHLLGQRLQRLPQDVGRNVRGPAPVLPGAASSTAAAPLAV